MANTNSGWDKFFLGFFVLTIICGLYLISQKDYVSGISGTITGVFLLYLNLKKAKDAKSNTDS